MPSSYSSSSSSSCASKNSPPLSVLNLLSTTKSSSLRHKCSICCGEKSQLLRRGEKKVDFKKLWDGEISKRFVNGGFNWLISAKKKKSKNVNEHKRQNEKNTGVPLLSFFFSHLSSSLLKSKPQRARLRFSWVFTKPFFGCFKEREREREATVCLSVCLFQKKNSSL